MHSLSSGTPRLGDEDDGEASSSSSQAKRDARFQEMQAALAAFESIGGIAPARERAFYSALRTLLAEVAGESEGYVDITGSGRVLATIETKLAAAHKWFTRSKWVLWA